MVLYGLAAAVFAHSPHDVVDVLAVSPGYERDDTLILGSSNRLLRSRDGGSSWSELSAGLDNRAFFSDIAMSPTFEVDGTVYVSTFGDGVYRSLDGGDSWSNTSSGLAGMTVTDLVVSPEYRQDGVLLAVVREKGLFRSGDQGENWQRVLDVGVERVGFARDGGSGLAVAGDATGRLYRSRDGGVSWEVLRSPLGGGAVTSIAIAGGGVPGKTVVYVATEDGNLHQSRDSGDHFEPVGGPFGDLRAPIVSVSVSPDYLHDRTVVVTTWEEAAFVSRDGGVSWQKQSSGLTTDPQSKSVKYRSPSFRDAVFSQGFGQDGILYVGGFDGLFMSTDAGKNWRQLEVMPVRLIRSLATASTERGDPVVGIGTYGAGAYFTSDGGDTWIIGNRGLTRTRLSRLTFSNDFANDRAVYSGVFGHVTKSLDGGESWTSIRHGEEKDFIYDARHLLSRALRKAGLDALNDDWFPEHTFIDPYPTIVAVSPDEKTLFFGTRWHGIYRSDDAGMTSTQLWDAGGHAVTDLLLSPDFSNDHSLFATVRTMGVVKSADAGVTWVGANRGLEPVRSWEGESQAHRAAMDVHLAMPDDYPRTGRLFAATDDGLYISDDRGETWSRAGATGTGGNIEAIAVSPDFATTGTVLMAVKGTGLRISRDGGRDFSELESAPPERFRYLAFSRRYAGDRTVFAASGQNLYRSTDGGERWTLLARPARYESNREPVRFSGSWTRHKGEPYSGLEATWSDSPGDHVELRFVGTGVSWLGDTGPAYGKADVRIDGRSAGPVDLYSAEPAIREVFRQQGLEHGPHRIEIIVSAERNPRSTGHRVSVDALDISP